MILPDVNLLIYAYNASAPAHAQARQWWESLLSDGGPVAMPWAVLFGFVRLVTHPRVMAHPLPAKAALDRVEAWFDTSAVEIVVPGPRHLQIVRTLFEATTVAASLTTDTHLAAMAIEQRCTLHSNDADFGRFPGLQWHNPLS